MKLLWAVNVFENHPGAISAVSKFLDALSSKESLKVDAATVIYPAKTSSGGKDKARFSELLKERLGSSIDEHWFGTSHALFETQIPQRVAVMDLIDLSEKGNYDAIIVAKHSYSGLKRAYLGSFAEMLAFLSPVPIFIINPDGFVPRELKKILFAAEGDSGCARDFRKLSNFVSLEETYFQVQHRIPVVFPDRLSQKEQKAYAKAEARRVSECLESIRKFGVKSGAKMKINVIQEKGTIEDSILSAGRRFQSDLTVIVHKAKGAAGFFLGRVSRRVIQNADRPVLLFRS